VCGTGFVILASTYAGMTTINRATPIAFVELLLILLGAGTAVVLAPTTELVMAAIPAVRAGAASAYNSAVRSVGGALGIAVLGSVLSHGVPVEDRRVPPHTPGPQPRDDGGIDRWHPGHHRCRTQHPPRPR
jgi:hypothetical protein